MPDGEPSLALFLSESFRQYLRWLRHALVNDLLAFHDGRRSSGGKAVVSQYTVWMHVHAPRLCKCFIFTFSARSMGLISVHSVLTAVVGGVYQSELD